MDLNASQESMPIHSSNTNTDGDSSHTLSNGTTNLDDKKCNSENPSCSIDCFHYKLLKKYFPDISNPISNTLGKSNSSKNSQLSRKTSRNHFSKKRDGLALLAELAAFYLTQLTQVDDDKQDSLLHSTCYLTLQSKERE